MKRLIYFPDGYPDEDFRSIVNRYHVHSENTMFETSKFELFGIKSSDHNIFPRNLDFLFNKLPIWHTFTKEQFIYKHSWYGVFKVFFTKERHNKFMESLLRGLSNLYGYKANINSSGVHHLLSTVIRYCPQCIQEDIECYGVSYVHLQHQLEFIDFCTKHHLKLMDCCNECNKLLDFSICRVLYNNNILCRDGHEIPSIKVDMTDQKVIFSHKLYKGIHYIWNRAEHINLEDIQRLFFSNLYHNGYINFKGFIHKKQLVEDVIQYFNPLLLKSIKISLDHIQSHNFRVKLLTMKHMCLDILFYVLLMIFLAGSVEDFLKLQKPYAIKIPFGVGPWECQNPICMGFQKKIIKKCERKLRNGIISVRFCCDLCGYTYAHNWPLKKSTDRFQVKNFGHLWENKFIELLSLGYLPKDIAKELKTSQRTIDRYIAKLNVFEKGIENDYMGLLKVFADARMETAVTKENEKKLLKGGNRYKIIKCIKSNAETDRKQIKIAERAAYDWLMKHDREWMEDNIPAARDKKTLVLDYGKLDLQMSSNIRKKAQKLYETYNFQVKKYTILNELSDVQRGRYLERSEKFPLSSKALHEFIEHDEDYQIRNIPRTYRKLKSKGIENVTFSYFTMYASVYRNCSERVKIRVLEYIRKMDSV